MFPLIVSYAITIHKSQSLSLSCVFADIGDEIFCAGMTYVAVSRCESYEGLYLMNFNPKRVKASRKACMEYARMLGKCNFTFNKGLKFDCKQRLWYTPSVHKTAVHTTADEIGKQKRRSTKPNSTTTTKNAVPKFKTGKQSTPAPRSKTAAKRKPNTKPSSAKASVSKPSAAQKSKTAENVRNVPKSETQSKDGSNKKTVPTTTEWQFDPTGRKTTGEVPNSSTKSHFKNRNKTPIVIDSKGKVRDKPASRNSFIIIQDNIEESVARILERTLLCSESDQLLANISPQTIANLYSTIFLPFGHQQ